MITIKSDEQIKSMRKAGKIVRDVLNLIEEKAKIGMSTKQLDNIAYEYIEKQNAIPSFLNYGGFPGSLCTSIDDEVVHGIPSKHRILEEGQLLKIDAGACIEGFHGDAARTFAIGKISDEKRKLMEVCKQSFFEGISILKENIRLGTLGYTIQSYVEKNGFSVVREMIGHGIGSDLHEDPNVPNYGIMGRGTRLSKNMTIAIEPMINLGKKEIFIGKDNWVVKTKDGMPSAHYENTVLILTDGVELLTL